MRILKETRKEGDSYFAGAFWIIADSVHEMLIGNFEIVGERLLTSFEGVRNRDREVKLQTHQNLWKEYGLNYKDKSYDYYPRGRVSVYNGKAYININSICNTPKIIDKIRKYYCVDKLDCVVTCNDIEQGSHYDFKLE